MRRHGQARRRKAWVQCAYLLTIEELKALPVSVAILDASGTIVAVNDAWKDFGRRNELSAQFASLRAI